MVLYQFFPSTDRVTLEGAIFKALKYPNKILQIKKEKNMHMTMLASRIIAPYSPKTSVQNKTKLTNIFSLPWANSPLFDIKIANSKHIIWLVQIKALHQSIFKQNGTQFS